MGRPLTEQQLALWRIWLRGASGAKRYSDFEALWFSHHGGQITQTCREAVQALVTLCPELRPVRGQVVMLNSPDLDTKPWPHWWATIEDGTIVDPTAMQFPSELRYIPHDESLGPPTGKCPNCGGLSYEHRYFCSETCERLYAEYVNGYRTSQEDLDRD